MKLIIRKPGEKVIEVPSGERAEVRVIYEDSGGNFFHRFVLHDGSELVYRAAIVVESGSLQGRIEVVLAGTDSKGDVEVRGFVKGELDIHMTGRILKGASDSEVRVASLVYQSDGAKVKAIPQLEVHELRSKSFHSFKKIYIDEEQLFYLRSRGINEHGIESLMKERVMEWIRRN